MRTLILVLLVYVVLADRVTHLPGYGDIDENWFSGYMRVTSQNQKNGSMYYWFFEGPKDAPVVVRAYSNFDVVGLVQWRTWMQ
jgi:hypothetical protein